MKKILMIFVMSLVLIMGSCGFGKEADAVSTDSTSVDSLVVDSVSQISADTIVLKK